MNQKLTNDALGRLSLDAYKTAQKTPLVLVLDNVRSLNNVGAAFRTADAFRIEQLVLCGVTGTPPHKDIEKTALGATASVNWVHAPSTLDAVKRLREEGYSVYAVEQATGSVPLHHFKPPAGKKALVFGNEVYGVEQQVIDACDGVVEIPQLGTKHSLNIAVSVGIVLWELLRGDLPAEK